MKIKQITTLWFRYMELMKKHEKVKPLSSEDQVAILYGSDQFKVDWKRSRIRMAGMWIPCGNLDPKSPSPDWVAMITEPEGKFSIVLGQGSPFDLDYHNEENVLFDGNMIVAMPSVVEAL